MRTNTFIISLKVLAAILLLCGAFSLGAGTAYARIKADCIYDNRLQFNDQLFSCLPLEGVTIRKGASDEAPY